MLRRADWQAAEAASLAAPASVLCGCVLVYGEGGSGHGRKRCAIGGSCSSRPGGGLAAGGRQQRHERTFGGRTTPSLPRWQQRHAAHWCAAIGRTPTSTPLRPARTCVVAPLRG